MNRYGSNTIIQHTIAKSVNQGDIQWSPQGLQQVGIYTKQLTLEGPGKTSNQIHGWCTVSKYQMNLNKSMLSNYVISIFSHFQKFLWNVPPWLDWFLKSLLLEMLISRNCANRTCYLEKKQFKRWGKSTINLNWHFEYWWQRKISQILLFVYRLVAHCQLQVVLVRGVLVPLNGWEHTCVHQWPNKDLQDWCTYIMV